MKRSEIRGCSSTKSLPAFRFASCGLRELRLSRPERIRKPRLRGAGAQRLLLALMRRPTGKPDDLERRAHLAVRIRKALSIDLRHALESRAPQRLAAAFDKNIG